MTALGRRRTKSTFDRDRFLRMKRAYDLMARGAEFGTSVDDLVRRLRTSLER